MDVRSQLLIRIFQMLKNIPICCALYIRIIELIDHEKGIIDNVSDSRYNVLLLR